MSEPTTIGVPAEPAVTVWWAHRSIAAALDDSLLSESERRRVSRLRGAADRERSAVARGVLRLALASVLPDYASDLAIDWEHGPVLPSSLGTWASISHSDDSVAIAVSTAGPIGIDVEALRRTNDLVPAVQEAVFTKQERGELRALAAPDRLPAALRLWTLKEAILKSTGDGLVRAPATVQIAAATTSPFLEHFEAREDLIGASQLHTLRPVVQPYILPGDEEFPAPVPAPPRPDPGAYVASLAVLTAEPVTIVEREAAELLA